MEQRRIEKIEERLEKLERTCGETEPIKVTRIEIDTGDVRERFDWINKRQANTEQSHYFFEGSVNRAGNSVRPASNDLYSGRHTRHRHCYAQTRDARR